MVFFNGQFITPVEEALADFELERLPGLVPHELFDVARTSVSVLPFLAFMFGIEGNIEFLPENVRRAIISNGHFFWNNVGTQAALDRAEEVLEVSITYTVVTVNTVETINIIVSPPAYAIGDANWATYIREFIACLIPITLALGTIVIEIAFQANLNLHGGFRAFSIYPNHGGVAINS